VIVTPHLEMPMLDSREKARDSNKRDLGQTETSSGPSLTAPPTISLPKGGGAIRGMGEKFAANPVTGTGSMSVPLATSPGRSGFSPQLSLSYDSGSGNGPFGLGWHLSLPSVTRKTDKGLPKYQDADESDVFILSGAEDLVPVLLQTAAKDWVREVVLPRTINQLSVGPISLIRKTASGDLSPGTTSRPGTARLKRAALPIRLTQ
jgi:hypothetical protein